MNAKYFLTCCSTAARIDRPPLVIDFWLLSDISFCLRVSGPPYLANVKILRMQCTFSQKLFIKKDHIYLIEIMNKKSLSLITVKAFINNLQKFQPPTVNSSCEKLHYTSSILTEMRQDFPKPLSYFCKVMLFSIFL